MFQAFTTFLRRRWKEVSNTFIFESHRNNQQDATV